MKKKMFYVLALMFAVIFFAACSDDDKPMIPPADLNATFGQDESTELTLKYGDVVLNDKQVKFETVDSKTATITLADVIPGEAETVIENVQLIAGNGEYTFSGNTGSKTRATTSSIEYNGSVKKGALSLNLKVTMADTNGWAKMYGLADLTLGNLEYGAPKPRPNVPLSGAAYISWSAINSANGYDMGKMNAVTFRGMLGIILPQVLQSVTLETDGNISAKYSSDAVEFNMSMITALTPEKIAELVAKKSWLSSPKGLAYWYQKDGKLYVKLNISAIIAQAASDSGQTGTDNTLASVISKLLEGDASKIKELLSGLGVNISDTTLNTLLGWVKNGIPLNVEVKDGHTYIYLDKKELDMLFTSTESQESDFAALMKFLTPIIPTEYKSILSMLNLIPQNWPNTTEFSLGLDLIAG